MSSSLAIRGGPKSIDESGPHFVWPRITKEAEAAVVAQLHKTVSIYDNGGIFGEFERSFAAYHGRKFGLLFSSGTAAIHAMYTAAGIRPGDEVICPTYTFFATATPLVQIGARAVFVDSGADGNIDPERIEAAITPRTKAITVTHMWGMPCNMSRITAIAAKADLLLFEDCSHAHGAEYSSQKVGTFGVAAAWSLQGAKTVTGGEGGILLTDSEDQYAAALCFGHYNKRCKSEIRSNHPLKKYALTGFGLKLRAHPLAIALAYQQFVHLDEFILQRETFAQEMIAALGSFKFISVPRTTNGRSSWYAFVFQYFADRAGGVPIERFHEALLAEGLLELDRPSSTAPIHNLPIFCDPPEFIPTFATSRMPRFEREFPAAAAFHARALKLPVWAFADDSRIVKAYCSGLAKVASRISELV
jgi:dTDP-4-amino-4,6-dideoxygalactose transaminase